MKRPTPETVSAHWLTRFFLGILAGVMLMLEPGFTQDYGPAPESLDYPSIEHLERPDDSKTYGRVDGSYFFEREEKSRTRVAKAAKKERAPRKQKSRR